MTEACAVNGCDRTAKARGYCKSHYRRWKKDGDPGKVFTALPSGEFRHGTSHAYDAHKCRCEECRESKRAKDRRQRASRKAAAAAGDAKVPHGTTAGYAKWSCRCEPCKQAQSDYMKTWREENPEKTAQYARRWRLAHADEIREYAREWREANQEKLAQERSEWMAGRRTQSFGNHEVTGYSYGCRCEECVSAKAEYMAEWRAAKVAEEIPHGTANGYSNYGCRCSDCRKAGLVRTNGQRQRRQVETIPTARNHGNQWTGAELEIVVTRTDLSLVKLGKLLGRTSYAVASARERATTDPKWIAVVGVSTAVVSEPE